VLIPGAAFVDTIGAAGLVRVSLKAPSVIPPA
jgi:hypothetical protein